MNIKKYFCVDNILKGLSDYFHLIVFNIQYILSTKPFARH